VDVGDKEVVAWQLVGGGRSKFSQGPGVYHSSVRTEVLLPQEAFVLRFLRGKTGYSTACTEAVVEMAAVH
jgi:hypothetical protein